MHNRLGKNWQEHYPASLTPEEKASLKAISKRQFSEGNGTFSDLLDYLKVVKFLSDYPEPDQGLSTRQTQTAVTPLLAENKSDQNYPQRHASGQIFATNCKST